MYLYTYIYIYRYIGMIIEIYCKDFVVTQSNNLPLGGWPAFCSRAEKAAGADHMHRVFGLGVGVF